MSTTTTEKLTFAVDSSYLLISGMLILLMQIGFAALEAGGTRPKHVKSLLYKNLIDHSIGCLAWFGIGWGLFTGNNADFFVPNIRDYSYLFNQFGFAATATTLVSGAVLGRMRLEAYLWLSFVLTGVIYPISAHWAWSSTGWLSTLGFIDFAGSTVVHSFGGFAALATAILCQPRVGRFIINTEYTGTGERYVKNGNEQQNENSMIQGVNHESETREAAVSIFEVEKEKYVRSLYFPMKRLLPNFILRTYCVRPIPNIHDPTLMVFGTLLLYVAWFAFNTSSAKSVVKATDPTVIAAVNTLLASGMGALVMLLLCILKKQRYNVSYACNSLLAALVAITAGCADFDPWAAVFVGMIAVFVQDLSSWIVIHLFGIDDALNVFSVHASAGAWGTVAVGLFHNSKGLFYTGSFYLLGVQLLGVLVISLYSFICTLVVLFPLKITKRLSYTYSEQLVGIDYVHFGSTLGRDVDLDHDLEGDSNTNHHSNKDDSSSAPRSLNPVFNDLRRVLNDDGINKTNRFRAFLEVSGKTTGVEFWDDVLRFKKTSGRIGHLTRKMNLAKKIIRTYCLDDSPKRVIYSAEVSRVLKEALNKDEVLVDQDLFDPALRVLFGDIQQAFYDFIEATPNYWH